MFAQTLADYSFQDTPRGIRIPVASVKGRCPRPLDDGGVSLALFRIAKLNTIVNTNSQPF
jgi:hypothetical protein